MHVCMYVSMYVVVYVLHQCGRMAFAEHWHKQLKLYVPNLLLAIESVVLL